MEIDWKTLSYALTFSVLGQFACLFINIESGLVIKHIYTCFLLLVAIILLDSFTHPPRTHALIFARKKLATAAFIGGLISGFLGAGADTLLFFYYVILMKQPAKKVIPTTVALMAANAIIGSILILSSNYVPSSFVITSWFFAAPVVALGAPLGGLIKSRYFLHAISLECRISSPRPDSLADGSPLSRKLYLSNYRGTVVFCTVFILQLELITVC
ncbi:sulfite exporter TauE/SafE family protein [Pseudoalteromonas sp. MSK9-3]|uniref:TSUP family transporter n=1 Tax=Pseudoalteromonas sp. MSK9-3 TaxID=1897633 RepID=UPI000E6C6BDB